MLADSVESNLRPWLLLLLLEKGKQRHTRDLDDLESYTGDISHGVTLPTKSSNQHLVLDRDTRKDSHISDAP